MGIPALRLTLEWLILLSLAFQTIVIGLLNALGQFGGSYGLENVQVDVFGVKLNTPTRILPVFLIFAVIVFLLCHRMGLSPYGRVLRSIREDDRASRSLGKNIFKYKLAVFAITSAMAGVAGAMLTVQNQLASPALFGFTQSAAIVVMVIFGGMGNLWGSVLGATLLVLSDPFLQHVVKLQASTASLWQLTIYGLLLVVVMFVRPQGILPEGASLRRWLASRRQRRRPSSASCHGWRRSGWTPTMAAVSEEEVEREDVATLADLRAHHAAPAEVADLAAARLAHRGEVVLEVRGLTKGFGGIRAADDLDMDFRRGTITALVGPNGAGKTTVFNLLTGAIRPDQGQVVLNGKDVTNLPPDRVARLGMVRSFQDVRVFARLTSLENVMLGVQGQAGERLTRLFLNPRRTARDEAATRQKGQGVAGLRGHDRLRRRARPAPSASGSRSWWPWPGCWPPRPKWCCWTSPPRASTSNGWMPCSASSSSSAPRAGRCASSSTTWPSSAGWPITPTSWSWAGSRPREALPI